MPRLNLPTTWTLRLLDGPDEVPKDIRNREILATVPGCVHTDLLDANLIPDPYLGTNESDLQWIGLCSWEYSAAFHVENDLLAYERVDLACDGLDTIAAVILNGDTLARTENMHVRYRWDVRSRLRIGENQIAIRFSSAVKYANAHEERLGSLPHVALIPTAPWNFIRKMACNFGWDWGPQLVTAGIWKPIYLDAWNALRISNVRPQVLEADERRAVIDIGIDFETTTSADEQRLSFTALMFRDSPDQPAGSAAAVVSAGAGRTRLLLEIENPDLWWPVGHGEQPLYTLRVMASPVGRAEHTADWVGRTGIRTAKLETEPDDIGQSFQILVNDKAIFCKGANWIPDDCFLNRVDEDRYRRRLQQGIDCNMNMMRVWGGGIYETDTFYDLCDEMGIMVWQDFLFACAGYPEEPPFPELIEAEARDNVARLARHPSLVIWNGCNENIWGYFNWDWQKKIGERTWGKHYYLHLLPRVVADLDSSRPYWPASPYSGSMDVEPNEATHGTKHVWEAWHGTEYDVYRNFKPRFCSEFGFQAPPAWATLDRALAKDQLEIESPGMQAHQKSKDGNARNHKFLEAFFPLPDDFDTQHYLLQLNQARALTLGVEWFRSLYPICTGTLYWQINDCWPVVSWAAIDGDERLKPLWYATRRFYADRILTFQPDDDELTLAVINDSDKSWSGSVKLTRLSFDGSANRSEALKFDAKPRSVATLSVPRTVSEPDDVAAEFLLAEADDHRAWWYFANDKELAYPEPRFKIDLEEQSGGYRCSLSAQSFLRDAALFVDRLDPDAVISDQLATLLPGEKIEFEIQTKTQMDAEKLSQRPVFQCANFYGRSDD